MILMGLFQLRIFYDSMIVFKEAMARRSKMELNWLLEI